MGFRSFLRHWKEWKAFKALPEEKRTLVFYSEGGGYLPHLAPVMLAWLKEYGSEIAYLSSETSDPYVQNPPPGIHGFCVGAGTVRTLLFAGLKAKVVVMTMPDLHTYYIKRSPFVQHYAYVHHSMVSTHMVYRPDAFDHFDSIFCVGPHHIHETRKREELLGLTQKRLFEHGYGRLDALIVSVSELGERPVLQDGVKGRVLVAPSWGENGILERLGADFLVPLLESGYQVTVRPHPQTGRLRPDVLSQVVSSLSRFPRFMLDQDMSSKQSLLEADVMISDWSGAALEFAFAFERPVVFVDVPRKVNNPEYTQLGIEPLEAEIRHRVGCVVAEDNLASLCNVVDGLMSKGALDAETIVAERERRIYNVGNSANIAANHLAELLR